MANLAIKAQLDALFSENDGIKFIFLKLFAEASSR